MAFIGLLLRLLGACRELQRRLTVHGMSERRAIDRRQAGIGWGMDTSPPALRDRSERRRVGVDSPAAPVSSHWSTGDWAREKQYGW